MKDLQQRRLARPIESEEDIYVASKREPNRVGAACEPFNLDI
jgi:hypothetical protein